MPAPNHALSRFKHALLIALTAFAIATGLHWMGALQGLENITWTWRVKLGAGTGPATHTIKLIAVDQASLNWAEQTIGETWPWPRQLYDYLLEVCEWSGAKSVCFDVLYTEASSWGRYDDEAFAAGITRNGAVALPVFLGETGIREPPWPMEVPRPPILIEPGGDAGLPRELRATFPTDLLATNAALLASVKAAPDADGVFRAVHPVSLFGGVAVPSLGLAAYLAPIVDTSEVFVTSTPGQLRVGDRKIPLDRQGRAILRFRGDTGTHEAISAAAVLQTAAQLTEGTAPVLSRDVFRDAHVFIGFTAPGLKDLRSTPVAGDYPGVEIHMTFLDNLLSGDLIRSFPFGLAMLLIALSTGATVLLVMLVNRMGGKLLVMTLFLLLPLGVGWIMYGHNSTWPVAYHGLATLLGLGIAVVFQYAVEGKQKRFIKQAFKHYLSGEVIEQMLADPTRLQLGGEKKELTIFFSDLQGFSGISERLGPTELTSLLNDYLSEMTDILLEEGGTLDKYEGDAIIAFWNAPVDQSDHAARCCRAALRCQQRLLERGPDFEAVAGQPLVMRIGIHTGPVVVGNMGSANRFNYTVLGDAANLASRLEGANKFTHTQLMISEATWCRLGRDRAGRCLGSLRVVGRKTPVKVYELFPPDRSMPEWTTRWNDAIAAVEKGHWTRALDLFETIPEQPLRTRYLDQLHGLCEGTVSEWDGVWVLDGK